MRMTVMLVAAVFAISGWPSLRAGTPGQCRAVTFTASLDAGNRFVQKVGDLKFAIRATHDKGFCNGWTFSMEDASGNDFIYPVNMPLRFNPSQFLGCSYGLTARQGLEMNRTMRFILAEQDYLRLDPLMENALWPGESPDPDHAAEIYLKAIRAVHTGLLRLKTVHFKLSPNGLIRSATFRVELIAPASFHFGSLLKPYSTACPAVPPE